MSDFTNAALDEEFIIKHFFPSSLVPIYYELNKRERTELPIQNVIFYLKANRIFDFDDAHYVKDEKLKNDVMFNVYGFLFYEHYMWKERTKNNTDYFSRRYLSLFRNILALNISHFCHKIFISELKMLI
mgnify:CR=1 FL=1